MFVATLSLLLLGVCLAQPLFDDPHFDADKYGIVHLFEWHWDTIANECETFLSQKKVGGVQISPPNENRIIDSRPWWERYQPVSYVLSTRSGDRDSLKNMIDRCNAVGVRIYADVVVNHMCGTGGTGTGTGGSYFDADNEIFPAVPYSSSDFNDGNCYTPSGNIENYDDVNQVRNCKLYGLLDLNQGADTVRSRISDYMNDLISLGVAGFRIDAAKYMLPDDLEVIYSSLNDLDPSVFGSGQRPFIYQEVIYSDGEPILPTDYSMDASVTDFKYGLELAANKDNIEYFNNVGQSLDLLPSSSALVFINNHDNQRGHGSGGTVVTFEDPSDLTILTDFMLAYPYGKARVMSSYYFTNSDQGPPPTERSVNVDGTCGNGWVCEHRWSEIANMFEFGAVVKDQPLQNWQSTAQNRFSFSRGNKGFFAANKNSNIMDEYVYTGLPDGSYCNVISGSLVNGECSGSCIEVQNNYARITINNDGSQAPIVALHVNAQTNSC